MSEHAPTIGQSFGAVGTSPVEWMVSSDLATVIGGFHPTNGSATILRLSVGVDKDVGAVGKPGDVGAPPEPDGVDAVLLGPGGESALVLGHTRLLAAG